MRIIKSEIKAYKFDELSDETKEKAIEKLYDINVSDSYWYDSIYEDAKTIGLKIDSLDDHRANKGLFFEDACHCADAIIKTHGEACETYKEAEAFLKDREKVIEQAEKDENGEFVNEHALDDELNDLESEFLKALLEDYRIMLNKEGEYLTSKEAIIDTIQANDYEFNEEGELI